MPSPGSVISPTNMTSNNVPSPYIASASSVGGFGGQQPWQMFSGVATNFWLGGSTATPNADDGFDSWQLDLGAGNESYLYSYIMLVGNASFPNSYLNAPSSWCFFGSVDGINWDLLDQQTNYAWPSGDSEQEFVLSIWPTAYRFVAMAISEIAAGPGNNVCINNVNVVSTSAPPPITSRGSQFAPANMVSDVSPSPFVASASYEGMPGYAYWAFNKGVYPIGGTQQWVSNGATGYLQVDMGSLAQLSSYQILGAYNGVDSAPVDFTLQGSNDGVAWTNLDGRVGQVKWGQSTGSVAYNNSRWYYAPQTIPYRYYRLNVTLIGFPGGNDLAVQQLYLYGSFPQPGNNPYPNLCLFGTLAL